MLNRRAAITSRAYPLGQVNSNPQRPQEQPQSSGADRTAASRVSPTHLPAFDPPSPNLRPASEFWVWIITRFQVALHLNRLARPRAAPSLNTGTFAHSHVTWSPSTPPSGQFTSPVIVSYELTPVAHHVEGYEKCQECDQGVFGYPGQGQRRLALTIAPATHSTANFRVNLATSNDPWGPTGTQMSEIAQMTFNTYVQIRNHGAMSKSLFNVN